MGGDILLCLIDEIGDLLDEIVELAAQLLLGGRFLRPAAGVGADPGCVHPAAVSATDSEDLFEDCAGRCRCAVASSSWSDFNSRDNTGSGARLSPLGFGLDRRVKDKDIRHDGISKKSAKQAKPISRR